MKKAILIVSIFLFPRLLVAQEFDIDSLVGESWYGLYLNGQKAGYALNSVEKDEAGNAVLLEDASFRIVMSGIRQDMSISSRRVYAPDGGLLRIAMTVTDVASVSEFNAHIDGDEMVLETNTGGTATTNRLPKPSESLEDAVKHARWVKGDPQVGDVLNFVVFEPMYAKEVSGVSHILGVETRMLDGVPTKVYEIKTSLDLMGIDSVSHVAESGETLEDVISGFITMRLESKEDAKDVAYSNDVIVSNAAMLEGPIEDARSRETIRLRIQGPLTEDHLYNDERQFVEQAGDAFNFVAHRMSLEDIEAPNLPIDNEAVTRWLKPTPFVQSDHEALVAKAKEIIGETTNTLEVSNKLCAWVNENMRSTFSARLTNALEVLGSLEGDCTEHSVLFIGLARAIGLPAREVAGLIYVDNPPGFYFHQWAKVWVGKWIDVDPTFNQPVADVTHIKLAEGDLFKQSRLIPVIGKLRIEVVEEEAAPPGGAAAAPEQATAEETRTTN